MLLQLAPSSPVGVLELGSVLLAGWGKLEPVE